MVIILNYQASLFVWCIYNYVIDSIEFTNTNDFGKIMGGISENILFD